MKLGVDTNVLVRYLVSDDAVQSKQATAQIEAADIVFISTVVLCETVWVLQRAYRYSSEEIVTAISAVVCSRNVETDRAAAEAGLGMLARGGDFADGVIEHQAAQARCDLLSTFDAKFRQLLGPALSDRRSAR